MRNLKHMGVVFALACSLIGFAGVGTAAAGSLTASAYPVSVGGEEGPDHQTFGVGGLGQFQCTNQLLTGDASSASETLETSYYDAGACNAFGEVSNVQTNGCGITFEFGSDAGHFDQFAGTLDIGPSNCGSIQLTQGICKVALPAQTDLAVSYENLPGGKVAANVSASGVKFNLSGPLCSGNSTGTWDARWVFSGSDNLAVQEDFSEVAFEAETYPASVQGSQVSAHVFSALGGAVECESATFVGEGTAPSKTIEVAPTYAGCEAFGFSPSPVITNGCEYRFHAESKIAADRFSGTADVACPGGNSIEVKVGTESGTICTVKIGSQSDLTGVEFVNNASTGHRVDVNMNIKGITFSVIRNNPLLCPLPAGTFTKGQIVGSTAMEGVGANGIRVGG